jgi:ubiquinone biosynthesis protein
MMTFQTFANINRLKDIVAVFARHGFEDVVRMLNLPGKRLTRRLVAPHPELSSSARLRLALEELGPTFIKFGQIMSLRAELLPAPLVAELGKLQDEVPPEDIDGIRQVIESSLGGPLEEIFIIFDEQPVAAASLSQVHRAVLRDGRIPLALKVQRPEIRSKIETDLDILTRAAKILNERASSLRMYDLPGLMHSVSQTLQRELDFSREARHMQIARNLMQGLAGVHVPRVYSDLSRERLLVMEYVQGRKLKEIERGSLPNAESLAKNAIAAAVKQVLADGFFHADPHPGNLLISDDGQTLSLLDWGMIGRLTRQDRHELVTLMEAISERDALSLTDTLLVITSGSGNPDRRELERDLLNLMDYHVTQSLDQLHLDRFFMDIMEIVRKHRLPIPSNHFITLKSLITAEGTARLLYPKLDVIGEIEPHVRRLTALHFKPDALWRQLRKLIFEIAASPTRLPRQIGEIIRKLEHGDLRLRFEHHNLADLITTLNKTFSRLTMGIIAAAMIIGSSLIITTGIPPLMMGYPVLGLVGYLISALLGLWIVFDILRSR